MDAEPGPAGIIPAYAGSTITYDSLTVSDVDHPRIRGEHLPRNRRKRAVRGSSPHTRGAHFTGHHFPSQSGIIPAYAGSTGTWR